MELTALHGLLVGFKGPTSKGSEETKDGREGQVRQEGRGPTSKARGGTGKEEEEKGRKEFLQL